MTQLLLNAKTWFRRNIALLLTLGVFLSVAFTYGTLTKGTRRLDASASQVWLLLVVNLVLLTALAAVIGRRAIFLWAALQKGIAGSRLQKRVVATFSLVAIFPALLVSIFAIFFFNLGIQAWFNERVSTAVNESLAVAEAYLAEHKESIRAESAAMAQDLNNVIGIAFSNPVEFNRLVSAQASMRSISEVLVFQKNRIIAQGRFTFAAAFENLPLNAIERAKDGEVVILDDDDDADKVRALVRLDAADDTYLLVGRLVDAKVLGHMAKTKGAVNQFSELQSNLSRIKWTFSLVFVSLALLLVLAAIWYGMQFAMRLVTPISNLVLAAERVKSGDYDARVNVTGEDDEMATLSRTFNRMAEQLGQQRTQLIEANRNLDERRKFTEAVLSGVSAGVLALDANARVTLSNRSAESVIKKSGVEHIQGCEVTEVFPGIEALLENARNSPGSLAHGTLHLGTGDRSLSLHVRITAEVDDTVVAGFIVTFDDITLLISAQRHAAWSDVARRVAHEIKNPLTPITLAAERIKRKYGKFIEEGEAETFHRYTDTITRHVGDIGRMVDEFVGFARMPNPVFKPEELTALIKKVVFSEQVAHADISYHMVLPEVQVYFSCDERQLTQVLTNLLKNAAESFEGSKEKINQPMIEVSLHIEGKRILIRINDNGPGFPPNAIERVLEPYYTTRIKGTGLGLAIAKKIVEDHQGALTLANSDAGGAVVLLSFPYNCDINAAIHA